MTVKISFIEHEGKAANLEISGLQMIGVNDSIITEIAFGVTKNGLERAYAQLSWILFRKEISPAEFEGLYDPHKYDYLKEEEIESLNSKLSKVKSGDRVKATFGRSDFHPQPIEGLLYENEEGLWVDLNSSISFQVMEKDGTMGNLLTDIEVIK